jgi:FtsZ-binding cell division protein ZapB
MADNLKTYSHNATTNMDNIGGQLAYLTQIDNLKKELEEVKKENKIITNKFNTTKKERDDFKGENKEL